MSSEMDEIWELFADDGQQALDAMETALDALQDGADDPTEHISALFRAVHTFKGNSRVLGLSVVESRAHLAEDLIGLVRDDGVPFDDDILDLMFLAGDTLRSMLEDVAANRADVDPEPSQDLLDQLKAMIAKVDPKADPADAPQEAAAEEASAAPEPAPEPEPTPEPEVAPEPEPAPEPEAVAEPTPEPTAAPEPAAAAGGAMADMNALFAEMGDSSFQNDDDALSFDEDLSEEELAAKEAARSADMEEAEAERPVQHGDAVVSSVVIDETPIDNFAQDPTYMKIWEEMTEDLVAKLEEIKTSGDGFDDRKLKTERQVDGLLHAAGQMGFPNWVSLLEDFAFDCPAIGDEAALVAAIDALLRDIEALKNGDAPSARPAATAPEPDATAPDTSGHVEPNPDAKLSDDPSYRAIFAEMADDLIARLKQGTDKDSAAQRDDAVAQVGGLLHAARQMEFDHWIATLEGFEESGPNLADGAVANAVAQLIADLEVLQQGGTPSAAAAPEAGPVPAAAPEPKAEPAAAPVVDPAPAAEPAPVAEKSATDQQAESSLAAQDACTSGEARKLSDDPTYRAIFAEMCEEFMGQLKDDLASGGSVNDRKTALRKHCDGLHHAASQMGFDPWIEVLDGFVDQLHDHGDLTALDGAVKKLIADAEALAATGGVAPSVESSEADNLFRQLEPYYAAIAEAVMFVEENPDEARKELGKLAATVIELIEPHGLVRAMDAINRLAKADQVKTARVEQLTFYEELIGYEQIMPAENRISGDLVVRPSNLVRQWATDQIFETLNALRLKIDRDTLTNEGMNWFAGFNHLMRLVYHACNHYRMETAANLTMALVDLFGRVKQSTNVADALMLHMARGFLDTIELVFEALDQGDEPDMDRVEELFEEATNITFQQGGVVSARTIERKLRLPEEFHRVLSPESVKTAHKALEEKKHFYIIRTDLNEDEVLAEKFLEWIGAGHAQMVTNVTIFQDDKTLFDFLLASELEQDGIVAAMTNMDPAADKLFMRMVLDPDYSAFEEDDAGEEEGNRQSSSEGDEGPGISLSMMETIGEISAGQAMVHHILEELMSNDIVQSVDNLLRRKAQQFGGGLDQPTQSAIRGLIEDYAHKVARAAEAESQLNTQMSRLQEETAKLRERKASILLRTLAAFVEARSRTVGNEARMSHSGGDVVVDQAMMDGLQRFLKRLIRSRLVKEGAPRKMHLGLNRTDNSVSVVLSDDGEVAVDPALIKDLEAEAVRKGGEFRVAPVPQGGQSFHLRLPVHMALLEGMVVRVGEVRYVVPVGAIERIQLGSSDALLPIPAQKNAAMLRTDTGELAPIRQLSVINGGMGIADAAASAKASGKKTQSLYVVLRNEDRRFAIPVDEMLGQQLVLLRPLQGPLTGIRNMMGLALLSGGEVGMVVAVDRLAEAA